MQIVCPSTVSVHKTFSDCMRVTAQLLLETVTVTYWTPESALDYFCFRRCIVDSGTFFWSTVHASALATKHLH